MREIIQLEGDFRMNTDVIKINELLIDENKIEAAGQLLKEGKLVAFPTETVYGLGANALTDTEFLSQYLGTSGDAEVGNNIDAITGATVSSKAVTRAVNSAVAYVTGADTTSAATTWGG